MITRLAIALVIAVAATTAVAAEWGEYIGTVVAEWLGNGREMKLTQEFAYRDPKGRVWKAPAGSVVDGASIPQIAWAFIGGPFEGKYREASVIHDVACNQKRETWEEVHETFYTAMLASGVDSLRAKVMYGAVYHFGPRWERKFRVRDVPASEVERQIGKYGAMSDSSRRVVATAENRRMVGGGDGPLASQGGSQRREVADIAVRVIPAKPQLVDGDFARLKSDIEKGNLSLEQIRAFKP